MAASEQWQHDDEHPMETTLTRITHLITDSIRSKERLLQEGTLLETCAQVAAAFVACLKNDGKILFCGNGGSAADAQHLAAELCGRFYLDRNPLFAEALHVNTSFLTAVANDCGFEEIYRRMVQAKGRQGDILVGISTSGRSENVIRALKQARVQGMVTVAMTGESGGDMRDLCDFLINVPSVDTPRIQECHILLGHILCQLTEEALFGSKNTV